MKKSSIYFAGTCALLFLVMAPLITHAVLFTSTAIVTSFASIVRIASGIVAALALIAFFWGIAKYISSAGDPKKAQEGKSIMIYGVIALFVLFSVFGLITFLRLEFMVGGDASLPIPRTY